jgi:hypothetical protein
MKKLFTLLFFLVLLASAYAGDRMVFVERFTSWTCPPCATNNPIMEAWLNSVDPDKVVGIAYHMNWPAPGTDSFYTPYNPIDNFARRTFYGVNAIPQGQMDGLLLVPLPYSNSGLTSLFNTRTNLLSPITLIVTDSTFGDSVMVRVKIYTEVYLANPIAKVHFSLQEKERHYAFAPGTNGEKDFYDVMRKMNDAGIGQTVTLFPGQVITIEKKFYIYPYYNPAQLMPIVFVQNGQEILNAGKKTNNFTLIPNSPYKSVQQGQSQSETFNFSIPVVAQGYNSAVTLTAEVDPPTAGVTVSFPNGNVVSTFPSNFNVQVNSTASVPAGAYRIVVTGTNTNSKVHKTSVSYLVGQNFIGVNSNRSNLKFKVDNVEYTNAALFTWDLSSQHTLSAVTPQTFGSTRYVFNNWSNGGGSTHTITTGTTTTQYTVNYKTQFKLVTSVTPSGIPVTVTGGNDFYDSSSTVSFSVAPTSIQYNNMMYYFQGWVGSGNGNYTGPNPQGTINAMNNVIVETAQYDTITPFGIQNLNTGVPKSFGLHQNYPNPFNPVTKIKFDIPKLTQAVIKVYDVIGNEVATLFSGELVPGFYEAELDGSSYASGVYFYRIESPDFTSVKRMVLIK